MRDRSVSTVSLDRPASFGRGNSRSKGLTDGSSWMHKVDAVTASASASASAGASASARARPADTLWSRVA